MKQDQLLICGSSNTWILAEEITSAASYVGIGTTSPSTLLHVNGTETLGSSTVVGVLVLNGNSSGSVTIEPSITTTAWTLTLPTSAGTNGYVLQTNGSGVTSWVSPGSGATITLGTSSTVTNPQRSGDPTTGFFSPTTSAVSVSIGGTEAMRINSVGLGIAVVPTNKLDVNGAAAFGTYAGTATAPTNGIITSGAVAIGTSTIVTGSTLTVKGTETLGVTGSTTGALAFAGSTSGTVTLQPNAAAGTWTMTLPTTAGTANYVLQTDGTGITSWGLPNVYFGTSASATSPQVLGDPTTGLYSPVSNTIAYAVAGSEELLINATGVGINTATIANSLDVYGGAAFGTYASSTAPTNGLIVSGNVAIGTTTSFNGSLLTVKGAESLGIVGQTTGTLAFAGSTSGMVTMQANATGGVWNMTLPTSAGTANYVLQTDGTGITSWVNPTVTLGTSASATNPQRPGDPTTGLYSAGSAVIGFSANGTTAMLIGANGVAVSTGTQLPANALDVAGAAAFGTYTGTSAPANGIAVSGHVGIGTSAAADGLDIATAGTATTAGLNLTGAWQGNGTTGYPQMLIQPSGSTAPTWNVNGVGLGINAPASYSGYNYLQFFNNATLVASVTGGGSLITAGSISNGYSGPLTLTGGPTSGTAAFQDFIFTGSGNVNGGSAGTSQFMELGNTAGEYQFYPTSGTAVLNNVQINGMVINQTGSATGVTRGLYIVPTVISAYDYRAFEVSTYTDNILSGTPTAQDVVINAPTLAAASTTTVTNAATEVIAGAPSAGTNVTITNDYALWVQNGLTRFDGNVVIGNTSAQATLDVNGYMRLTKYSSQPAACSSTNDGAIALSAVYTVCICNGGSSSWVQSKDGTTACVW